MLKFDFKRSEQVAVVTCFLRSSFSQITRHIWSGHTLNSCTEGCSYGDGDVEGAVWKRSVFSRTNDGRDPWDRANVLNAFFFAHKKRLFPWNIFKTGMAGICIESLHMCWYSQNCQDITKNLTNNIINMPLKVTQNMAGTCAFHLCTEKVWQMTYFHVEV